MPLIVSAATTRPVLNLLLVDDHTVVREGLKRLIDAEANRWSITEAGTGFQALECLRREPIDLAIVDLSMPGMSGPDLQRELKIRRQEIPIVFITARRDENIRPRLLEQGAVECLFKPFSDTALLEALNAALQVN